MSHRQYLWCHLHSIIVLNMNNLRRKTLRGVLVTRKTCRRTDGRTGPFSEYPTFSTKKSTDINRTSFTHDCSPNGFKFNIHLKAGNHWSTRETPFEWRFVAGRWWPVTVCWLGTSVERIRFRKLYSEERTCTSLHVPCNCS